ncbi:MAG: hypothetical protein V1900_00695 [Candidatus Aenigmatarchaeota archaeon]
MSLPVIDLSKCYKRGEQITYDNLRQKIPELKTATKQVLQKFLSSYTGPGMVEHKTSGNYFSLKTEEISDDVHITAATKLNPYEEWLSKIAYEEFDRHPSIFRGVVKGISGYKKSVDFLSSDGTTRSGNLTSFYSGGLAGQKREIIENVRKDDIIVVRHLGVDRESGIILEPVVFIREYDCLTNNGRHIFTTVRNDTIENILVVNHGKQNEHGTSYDKYRDVVGYVFYNGAIPVFIKGSDGGVGVILPKLRIVRKELDFSRHFIIAEIDNNTAKPYMDFWRM